jgi:hypothetical protein
MNSYKESKGYSRINSEELIARFVNSWYSRATVRRPWDWQPALNTDAPDFLISLLPFKDDPEFKQSSEGTKTQCLTAGWLIYNYKTIAIETQIIIPACNDLLEFNTRRKLSSYAMSALAETITDEGFHTLVSLELCRMTSSFRGLDLHLPAFDLMRQLKEHQLINTPHHFRLVRLAYATVSEVFISDYLSLLSEAQAIQPLFRSAVMLHKADEICHKRLFPMLIGPVIQDCNQEEKDIFVSAIYEAVQAFSSRETKVWSEALSQIYSARLDCNTKNLPVCTELKGEADFTAVDELLTELMLTEVTYQV